MLMGGGGERGIRTHDRVSPIHAFQACAFNHSAISPSRGGVCVIAFSLTSGRSSQPCTATRCAGQEKDHAIAPLSAKQIIFKGFRRRVWIFCARSKNTTTATGFANENTFTKRA